MNNKKSHKSKNKTTLNSKRDKDWLINDLDKVNHGFKGILKKIERNRPNPDKPKIK